MPWQTLFLSVNRRIVKEDGEIEYQVDSAVDLVTAGSFRINTEGSIRQDYKIVQDLHVNLVW
jgi:hypothetical protein